MANGFLPDTTPPGTAQAPLSPLPKAPIAAAAPPAPRGPSFPRKKVTNPRQKAAIAAKKRMGK